RYNDQLPCDISDSYREIIKSFYQRYLEEISKFNRDELKGQDVLSYDVFKREMKIQLEGLSFNDNLIPINQFWGMHLTFAQLGSGAGNQPFKTVKDYEDFPKRIHGFVIWVDTAIVNMRRGLEQKFVLSKILAERMLPQMQSMLVKDVKESVFYAPIKKMPETFSAQDKERLVNLYSKAITDEVISSYKKLYDFLRDEYIPGCRKSSGISDIPDGKEYYAFLAKFWTTTNLTPDEIFETGQKEVARLRAEMERIKNETGFKGELKSFFHFIHTDKKFMPYKEPAEVINAYKEIETLMQPQLKKLFNLVPKSKFEVRQTEKFREASASAEYNQAAPDGSRPGIFYVPVPDAKKFNVVGMDDLFLHEAIPGHHYQISIQQENEQLPKFRRFGWYGAYGEGWALYCESLGKELGLYTDPYQYFGSLSEEMHRAIRLVVDVGMHLKGWTREQAIQFSLDNEAESEADITSEIERYMAIPGQALAYKIGQLKIIEIRKRAEQTLGDKFSVQKFHDEVLIDGCLPLDVFENKMNAWIKMQQN
ncbi:MAG: DUF885 domain-containing protein, partial [Bacteroidia bacterium]|nr:DUF885 domain-containing protein [Bacteroidia bacterium]